MNDSTPEKDSMPDMPLSPLAKARAVLNRSPEERWSRELSSSDPMREAGAALALGRLAAAKGDLEEAVRLLGRAASSEEPTVTPRALVQMVPALEALGRSTDADRALHNAEASSDPEHAPDVILDVSAILVRRGRSGRAVRVLESVVKAWPDKDRATDDGTGLVRAIAALRLGNLLAERGDTPAAIPHWRLAMRANFPAVTPQAALRLADASVVEHQNGGTRPPAEIEELYRVAIDFDHPSASPEAALKLADFFLTKKQAQLAINEYDLLLELGGDIARRAESGLELARREPQRVEKVIQFARSRTSKVIAGPKGVGARRVPTLVVGAGTGGMYLMRDLGDPYEVVGWIDDGHEKDTEINNVRVLGKIDDLPRVLATRKSTKAVFIAIPTMSGAQRRKVVEAVLGSDPQIELKNLPSMFELRRDRNIFRQLRAVRVEETIGAQSMHIDREAGAIVRGGSVMITSAGSTIGSELSRQVAHARARYLSLIDSSTTALRLVLGDLQRHRDYKRAHGVLASFDHSDTMLKALKMHSPEVVFHVGGHAHAPIVEDHPLEAMRTEFLGSWNFARLCGQIGVKRFVFISNDAAAEPRGVFSACKALTERAVAHVAAEFPETDFVTVRPGSVYRSPGSVVEIFEQQIGDGGPVTLTTDDAKRRFMRVELATQLLLRTACAAESGSLYALYGKEEVAIRDLAEWMIRMNGDQLEKIGIDIVGRRDHESRLDAPAGPREVEVSSDIGEEVVEIELEQYPPDVVQMTLETVKKAIDSDDSVELRNLIGEGVATLLDDERARCANLIMAP
ncbi:MAG: polysaccharide biosynthesis protein [Solirubrobacterales bacterium]|nr:polysaccharide biosynthesis protein [Solirubrobacterales bacterium]